MRTENKQSTEKPAIDGHVGLAEARTIPILFSAPMGQANLDGRKTQTRRTNKLEKINERLNDWELVGKVLEHGTCRDVFRFKNKNSRELVDIRCPYGQPGDILWVRETFAGRLNGTFDYK